jgi:hypothetical protein
MMTLDWQVLIAAFMAISLQITISINLMFGRSAIRKCNIWRETTIRVFGRSTPLVTPQ